MKKLMAWIRDKKNGNRCQNCSDTLIECLSGSAHLIKKGNEEKIVCGVCLERYIADGWEQINMIQS